MDPNYKLDYALKAAQWERAKGELRSLVALQGAYLARRGSTEPRWIQLSKRVEAFIKEIEDEALQE